MMRASLAVLAFALAACSPPARQQQSADNSTDATAPVIAAGCTAEASQDWSAVGSSYYEIEAQASGATCREATATIRINSRTDAVLFEHDYRIADVPLAFNPNADQTGLRSDLGAWLQNTADPATATGLPAWPAGAARPPGFQPVVSRARYEAARGAGGPLFCFPDGNESNACVAMDGDTATLLGSLTPERP